MSGPISDEQKHQKEIEFFLYSLACDNKKRSKDFNKLFGYANDLSAQVTHLETELKKKDKEIKHLKANCELGCG
jgi:peptidoglycan hydrolase CwlO-like protein